jgi:hypothetical protein
MASTRAVKLPVATELWQGLAKASSRFFTADADRSDDLLVEFVRRDLTAAIRFLRAVLIFSGVAGIVMCGICTLYLSLNWSSSGSCERPLRWWLLVHALLQLLQAPVRFVLLSRIRCAEVAQTSMEECIASFTASPAWRASKNVSLFTYGWFVLGIVWVVNAGDCAACPGCFRITVFVLVQAVARAIGALCCYHRWFPTEPEGEAAPRVEAATTQQIAALPLVLCTPDLFSEPGANCAVCLSEFAVDERLRRLPCGHYFHRRCADEWLRRSKRCPLCIRAIDEAVDSPCCKKAR